MSHPQRILLDIWWHAHKERQLREGMGAPGELAAASMSLIMHLLERGIKELQDAQDAQDNSPPMTIFAKFKKWLVGNKKP